MDDSRPRLDSDYLYLPIYTRIFFYVLTFWKLQKGIMLLRDTAGPRIYSYNGLCAITSTTPRKEKRALSLYYNVNVYQFNLLEWQWNLPSYTIMSTGRYYKAAYYRYNSSSFERFKIFNCFLKTLLFILHLIYWAIKNFYHFKNWLFKIMLYLLAISNLRSMILQEL